MLSKDLSRLLQEQGQKQESPEMEVLKRRLRNKDFWIWHSDRHQAQSRVSNENTKGDCCFNHIVGLPSKNGESKPIFDYEKQIYRALMEPSYLNSNLNISSTIPRAYSLAEKEIRRKALAETTYADFKNKHVFIKKATGLGVTEFMLRFRKKKAWLCLRNDDYRNSQMVIITGPNIDIAIKLIKRLKGLFEPHGIIFDSKETVIELNGCTIEAYPSNHIDAFRSLTNPKFILIEEGDFFRKNEQEDVRHVAERYIGKSDPFIVMVSTPNVPNGLFAKIEKEPFETCINKKMFLDYTYGLDNIYTNQEIEKAKQSPSFPREYQLQYLGIIGNVFTTSSIERCQTDYNPNNIVQDAKKSMGLDPAWGSSSFAIVVTQYVDGKIQVIFADEFPRPIFKSMIDKVWEIKNRCGLISNIYVDAANPEIISTLKQDFNEDYGEQYIKDKIAFCKKNNFLLENSMLVVPVSFSIEGPYMLQHTKTLLEDEDNLIQIHPSYDKLLTSLRTAVASEMKLDKEQTSYNDLLDAFRMSLKYYRLKS